MKASLFRSLDSAAMAKDIRAAQHSVCYAAPGIQNEPAKAMAEVAERIGPELITVCLDFARVVFAQPVIAASPARSLGAGTAQGHMRRIFGGCEPIRICADRCYSSPR